MIPLLTDWVVGRVVGYLWLAATVGYPGSNPDLYSQAWLGAIQASLYDLVIFTGPGDEAQVAAAATIAGAHQQWRQGHIAGSSFLYRSADCSIS